MEEIEKNGEQPQNVQPSIEENQLGSPSDLQEDLNAQADEAERGVPIGKFKNAQDLLNAYNNLQAEFTRKSQKLAEVEKEMASMPSQEEKLDGSFQSFLTKNPEAVSYAQELKARVGSEQAADEKAFEQAWAGLLYEKLTCQGKTKEPIIQDLILKDDEIQELVIKNYMKQLTSKKTPIVMSSGSGERVTKTVAPKPGSFEDAKKVVLDLFS